MTETSVKELEARLVDLEREVAELKGKTRPIPVAKPKPLPKPSNSPGTRPIPQWPDSMQSARTTSTAPRRESPPPRETLTLEEILSPRNLAIAGAIAVLAGLVFLVSYGISNGWITEEARELGAALFAAFLAGSGIYLRQAKDLAAPAEALVVVGLAGLFVSLVAATRLYGLIDPTLALVFSAAIATFGLSIGLYWRSEALSAAVLSAALLAPLMVGAEYDPGLLTFLVPVFAVAVAAAVLRPWEVVFPITATLFLASLLTSVSQAEGSNVFTAFGLSLLTIGLVITGSVGRSIWKRRPAADQETFIFGLFFSVVALIGTLLVTGSEKPLIECSSETVGCVSNFSTAAAIWLFITSGIASGIWWMAKQRAQHTLAVTAFALGSASLAAGLGFLFEGGPMLTVAWSAEAAVLIGLGRNQWQRLVGLAVLTAAISCALVEVPPSVLVESTDTLWRDLAAVSPLLLPLGLLAWRERDGLEEVGLGLSTCFTAYIALIICGFVTEPSSILTLVPLCLVAVIPACLDNRVWSWAMLTIFGTAAVGFAIGTALPLDALVNGVPSATEAILASTALVVSALALALFGPTNWRQFAFWSAAGIALYSLSILIVDGFQGGTDVSGELPLEAQGQVIVSSLWALVGLGLVIAGLIRSRLSWRKGGLILLILALAKITLYDLASLGTAGRTISFIAVGLILLAAAFAYQWMNRRTAP